MHIGHKRISTDDPVYIIAELGVNHDGSVDRALELVDAAASAGADAIKLQLFEADRLMSKAAKLAAYQKAAGESDPVAMLKRLELTIDQMAPIVARAHAKNIHAIVTVFSVELVDEAERLPWDAYKTASPDIVHKPLLERLMQTGKPLIVSTGASTIEEVTQAVKWLAPTRERLAFLQCVSSYPARDAAYGGIQAIKEMFHGPVGYSDHVANQNSGGSAVIAGACILEKHLTYNRRAQGPDHAASLVPWMMKNYVEEAQRSIAARPYYNSTPDFQTHFRTAFAQSDPTIKLLMQRAFDARGEIKKVVLDAERDVRTVSRQSLTTTRSLPIGHTLTRADLTFKRPGTGLLPYQLDDVLGRTLAHAVDADMPLMESDLAA
jgi:sialic acid synthase SpsE